MHVVRVVAMWSSFGCHVAVGDVAAGLSVTMGMEGSVWVSLPGVVVLVMGMRHWTAPEMMQSVGNSDPLPRMRLSRNIERENQAISQKTHF